MKNTFQSTPGLIIPIVLKILQSIDNIIGTEKGNKCVCICWPSCFQEISEFFNFLLPSRCWVFSFVCLFCFDGGGGFVFGSILIFIPPQRSFWLVRQSVRQSFSLASFFVSANPLKQRHEILSNFVGIKDKMFRCTFYRKSSWKVHTMFHCVEWCHSLIGVLFATKLLVGVYKDPPIYQMMLTAETNVGENKVVHVFASQNLHRELFVNKRDDF